MGKDRILQVSKRMSEVENVTRGVQTGISARKVHEHVALAAPRDSLSVPRMLLHDVFRKSVCYDASYT